MVVSQVVYEIKKKWNFDVLKTNCVYYNNLVDILVIYILLYVNRHERNTRILFVYVSISIHGQLRFHNNFL